MSGCEGSNSGTDAEEFRDSLEANRFGLDLPDDLLELVSTDSPDELLDGLDGDEVSDELLEAAESNDSPDELLDGLDGGEVSDELLEELLEAAELDIGTEVTGQEAEVAKLEGVTYEEEYERLWGEGK